MQQHPTISLAEIENMDGTKRSEYFDKFYRHLLNSRVSTSHITVRQKLLVIFARVLRHFPLDIRGIDNVPSNGCIVLINHSNEHDMPIIEEVLIKQKIPTTLLAEENHISPLIKYLFTQMNYTWINRKDKTSCWNGLYDLTNKVIYGNAGIIFGESTWNLHPIKPMQSIKIGPAIAGAISKKPIVPAIMEYIEADGFVAKEKKLYKKCIIKFGKPIRINPEESLIQQTKMLQATMEEMRRNLWKENGINRESLNDIQPEIYVNHTGLKWFSKACDLEYEIEKEHLHTAKNEAPEYMYTINEFGEFVPGEISKELLEKTIRKMF